WRRMNVDGSPGCSRNSVATPAPWRASGKRLISEKRMPGATPVDRTVHAHQRDRVQVADDAVGLDRLIGHFDTRLSKSGIECGQGLILDIQAQNLNSERSRRRSSVEAEEDWRCAPSSLAKRH